MKKPVIEFKDFTFQYRVQESPTLNNINLTIYKGEKVLVVGPSGSGKSTISSCINGLAPFFFAGDIKGSLKINGKETISSSIAELANEVGTVLQDPDGQFIGLTVAEDIAFKLENDCIDQDEMKKRVQAVSEIVDLENNLDLEPHKLSGGQKQRVTLAGVMVNDVDILLFDEPLASLDPATGRKSIKLIDSLHKENKKTIIIIEHRLEEVLEGEVDRIIVINDGIILADLSADKLLATNILAKNGIREPFYITALKYAGIKITEEMKAASIKSIDISGELDKISEWSDKLTLTDKKSENEKLLEFKNVEFKYQNDAKRVLKDVSFDIKKGEVLSIVGKNGAGKSTISKLICGFYKASKGEILFEGKNINDKSIKEIAEDIGMVMQNPNQMISKAMIFEEVGLGLKARGFSEEEINKRVIKALKICGLYEYRNWPISALSYGQKKRVTVASILVLNPKIIILDEPTAGQDFKHYTEIMEFLRSLNKQGITIVLITHDMHLMLEYTDRTIVLSEGLKIADDLPTSIITDEKVIKASNLRQTSLYELAIKLNLKNPKDFVRGFIEYDRRSR